MVLAQGVLGGALAERLPSNVDPRSRALAEKLLRDVDAYPRPRFHPDLVQPRQPGVGCTRRFWTKHFMTRPFSDEPV